MIVLRAIPFSVAILWRYLLVFPFLLLAFVVFGFIALFLVLIFGFVSPLLGVLIAMAFGVSFSIVPTMVGLRLGLQAKQMRPRVGYMAMLIPALGYGILEGGVALVLMALGIGAFVLFAGVPFMDLLALGALDSTEIFSELLEINPLLAVIVTLSGVLATFCLRAALLVPLAGASIGEDANGRRHAAFYGMGLGFYSNLVLVILSYIGTAIVVPLVFYILISFGYSDVVEETALKASEISDVDDFLEIAFELGVFTAMCVFFYLWAFSLQCAGGVLSYMRAVGRIKDGPLLSQPELEKVLNEPVDKIELKALRRSRMPPQNR